MEIMFACLGCDLGLGVGLVWRAPPLSPPPLFPSIWALAHQTIVILGGFTPGICSVTIWAWLSFAGISGVALSSVCFCGWTMLRFSSRNKVRERERQALQFAVGTCAWRDLGIAFERCGGE